MRAGGLSLSNRVWIARFVATTKGIQDEDGYEYPEEKPNLGFGPRILSAIMSARPTPYDEDAGNGIQVGRWPADAAAW